MSRIKLVVLSLLLSCFSLDIIFGMGINREIIGKNDSSKNTNVSAKKAAAQHATTSAVWQELNPLGLFVAGVGVLGGVIVSLFIPESFDSSTSTGGRTSIDPDISSKSFTDYKKYASLDDKKSN